MGDWLLMIMKHKMELDLLRAQIDAELARRKAQAQARHCETQRLLIMAEWHDRNIGPDAQREAAEAITKARAIDGVQG